MHRSRGSLLIAVLLAAALLPASQVSAAAEPATPPLANLAHLDWLRTSVTPPAQPGHTSYRLAQEPSVGVLWTYADRQPDGSYRRIGGGRHDPVADTWGQGAYNADDISRASVAYLRHWRLTGADTSRTAAYQLLRGLAYLQTVEGPNTGNVVLWMQPDGTLNHSAEPPDNPDPSDSGDSYWLARTIWAYGEGYAAFRDADPDFATFLRQRLGLALDAVQRQVLVHDGEWLDLDGAPVPAWLIQDGADSTGEALLGLAAYVSANPDDSRARHVLDRLAAAVALMRAGDPDQWPYGAILPWARSRAVWHAWGGLAPAGLARAYQVLGVDRLAEAAVSDAASFTPHLLVAAGPQNGWLPAPTDQVQISYGVESRIESLLAVSQATDRAGLATLAGVAAAWYFGANPAGAQMYDPATGRTFDGVDGSGRVNRNSGAESTIHGVLAMLWLDAHPGLIPVARTARIADRRAWQLVEAESGTLSGDATVHHPASAWTGESLWSGGAGVRLGPGGQVRLQTGAAVPSRLLPVVELTPGAGRTRWGAAGLVRHDAVGEQGDSPAPGLLAVQTLPTTVQDAAVTVTGLDGSALLDAVLVQPEVEWLVLGGDDHGTALVRSFATASRSAQVVVPGAGVASVSVYDPQGRLLLTYRSTAQEVRIPLPSGGFALVRR